MTPDDSNRIRAKQRARATVMALLLGFLVVLIFFGYTFCPDACPTTLSKLASVYRRLGSDAKQVKTLYISVDPERDTPQLLKEFTGSFHPNIVGLTGTSAQIAEVVAKEFA